jgi:isopentenyl-diphosphate Delta-isomerase
VGERLLHPSALGRGHGGLRPRRLREELGIDGLALVPRDRVEYRAAVGKGWSSTRWSASSRPRRRPPGPGARPGDEVPSPLDRARRAEGRDRARPEAFTPWLRIYLAEHGGQIFGACAA